MLKLEIKFDAARIASEQKYTLASICDALDKAIWEDTSSPQQN